MHYLIFINQMKRIKNEFSEFVNGGRGMRTYCRRRKFWATREGRVWKRRRFGEGNCCYRRRRDTWRWRKSARVGRRVEKAVGGGSGGIGRRRRGRRRWWRRRRIHRRPPWELVKEWMENKNKNVVQWITRVFSMRRMGALCLTNQKVRLGGFLYIMGCELSPHRPIL